MQNFREDPRFSHNLWYTARLWCTVLEASWSSHVESEAERSAARMPIDRALHALPQLPQEMGEGILRHERSRWCEIGLKDWKRTGRAGQPYVEHPWQKGITKPIILSAVFQAFDRGVHHRDQVLIESVGEILDARCDTVLLPNGKTGKLGILDKRHGKRLDGLTERYVPALKSGKLKLWDRLLRKPVTAEELIEIDQQRTRAVESALLKIQSLEAK
jgi:hypothetical protein